MDFFSGTTTASAFLASVSTSLGDTFDSVAPVVAVIGGVILAISFAPVLLSWVRSALSRRGTR